jgi:hypothetical protein
MRGPSPTPAAQAIRAKGAPITAGSSQKPIGSGTRTPARWAAAIKAYSCQRGRLDAMVADASLRSTKVLLSPPMRQRTRQFSWMDPPLIGSTPSRAKSPAASVSAIQAPSLVVCS